MPTFSSHELKIGLNEFFLNNVKCTTKTTIFDRNEKVKIQDTIKVM